MGRVGEKSLGFFCFFFFSLLTPEDPTRPVQVQVDQGVLTIGIVQNTVTLSVLKLGSSASLETLQRTAPQPNQAFFFFFFTSSHFLSEVSAELGRVDVRAAHCSSNMNIDAPSSAVGGALGRGAAVESSPVLLIPGFCCSGHPMSQTQTLGSHSPDARASPGLAC